VATELDVVATVCEVRLEPAKRRARHAELVTNPLEENAVADRIKRRRWYI